MINVIKKKWERLPDESSKQFKAFSIYRDLGPTRSIGEVANLWSESGATSRLREWSTKNNWKDRSIAYDAHIDQIMRGSHEEEVKKMVSRHTQEAKLFQSKVHERLEHLNPDELKPHELIKWYEIAVKIERLSRGVPTENIKREEIKGVNEDIISPETLAKSEVRKKANQLIKAIADSQSSTDGAGTTSE